jgi:exonuclease SbcD
MLRIFHTADWHLGQTFHNYDREYEHGCFLAWLLDRITERKPDALIIAGDVFDSINPPATAQNQYYGFLAGALKAHPQLQVVVTAGNHDAAARLEASGPILQRMNIHVVGRVNEGSRDENDFSKFTIPLMDASGKVGAIVLAIPYLRMSDLPHVPEAAEGYTAGVREFYRRATDYARALRDRNHPGAALFAMGHCHMQDGAMSEGSERNLVVGGLEALQSDAFPAALGYVALGHLHKPQSIDNGRVRYCGSPIPLSFSEREYQHQILEVAFAGGKLARVDSIEIPRTVQLLRLPRGKAVPITELLAILAGEPFSPELPEERHPFLELRYLDDGPDPTRRHQVEQVLAGKPVRLASTKFERPNVTENGDAQPDMAGFADLHSVDPRDVFAAAFREAFNAEPDEALLGAFKEILAEVGE